MAAGWILFRVRNGYGTAPSAMVANQDYSARKGFKRFKFMRNMIAVDERSERILKAYRSASREFVDGHTEAFIQDLPSIFHMGDLVGYMELIELPPSVVHQWAESHDAGASIRSGYDYYASKFDDVMFYPQDGEESRFARHYMRNFGFDFAAEAREVLGFVKKIPYL